MLCCQERIKLPSLVRGGFFNCRESGRTVTWGNVDIPFKALQQRSCTVHEDKPAERPTDIGLSRYRDQTTFSLLGIGSPRRDGESLHWCCLYCMCCMAKERTSVYRPVTPTPFFILYQIQSNLKEAHTHTHKYQKANGKRLTFQRSPLAHGSEHVWQLSSPERSLKFLFSSSVGARFIYPPGAMLHIFSRLFPMLPRHWVYILNYKHQNAPLFHIHIQHDFVAWGREFDKFGCEILEWTGVVQWWSEWKSRHILLLGANPTDLCGSLV